MGNCTPLSKFYTETCTLAEHQLLKRVRQLCKGNGGPIIIQLEIVTRHKLRVLPVLSEETKQHIDTFGAS